MFGTQKKEEIDNYTDYSDADPFLSLPIRNGKERIRCYITVSYTHLTLPTIYSV